jgi:type I restriction enzyme, S subunit
MKTQTNIPTLRFPEFDGEWKKCILDDVTKYVKGFAFKSEDYQDNGIRIVRVSDLSSDRIKQDNDKVFIEETKSKLYEKYKLKSGNIIITTVGSKPEMVESAVGRGIFIHDDNEGLLNQNMLKFDNIKNVDNGYIMGLINSKRYQHYMKSIARGNANQANITVVDLLQYQISIPTLPEQEKIASFLSEVDEKIQQLTRKAELLEQYKKGVMQQLFSGALRFKDDNGKDFPEWEEKKLGDLAHRVTRKNKENNLNVLTISAQLGLVSQLEYFNKSVSAKDVTNYYLLEKNDFAYNKSYSNGYPMGAIKRLKKYDKGVVSTLYICFCFNETVSLNFMEQFFEFGQHNKEIEKVAQEGARNHGLLNIGVNDFFNIELIMPSFPEQQTIAEFLSGIDEKIAETNGLLEKNKAFKKGLLQQMFV